MEVMDRLISPKLANKFYCEKCDYRCRKESDFNKHLATLKHNGNKRGFDGNEKLADLFRCDKCNKYYK